MITMSVEYRPDSGEGEHVPGLRVHKGHFLS